MPICRVIAAAAALAAMPSLYMGLPAQTSSLRGNVYAIEGDVKTPVDYAVVNLKTAGVYASTDSKGDYVIDRIDPGRYEVRVEALGYKTIDTVMVIRGNAIADFCMLESTFRLTEVQVVAEASKAGESTASTISRQAIDHSQTSSLSDIMQLLPGVSFSNPNLSSAQSLSLRTASVTDMNSLGTAVIVDGSPLSNNANMEGISTAVSGIATPLAGTSTSAGGAVTGQGIDVRQISTDNIESVEVIRGIPSVQYGDLTSGAVIVNSKAGAEPLTVRLKTDPKIYQVSASKGFKMSERAGDLNISTDYAWSTAKTTEAYAYYQRLNCKALWSKRTGRLGTNTSLTLNLGKDTRNRNKDDASISLASGGTNIGWRLASNGTWNISRGWLKTLRYSVSNSYTYKESFREQDYINAISLYTTNMTSGTTVAGERGQHIFGSDGTELTHFLDGQSDYAMITPYTYFCHYDFYSGEVNTYAQLSATLFKSWGETSEKILVGADFKSDGNLGRGLVFEEGRPPQSTTSGAGYRERPLYDIPFVNQTGAFAESSFKTSVLDRAFSLTGGVRLDVVSSLSALSPRLNASYELIPHVLALRGGYGITAKAPTVGYLHPNTSWYDQLNINRSGATDPKDRVVMATTYSFDTGNPDLEMARNRKFELGADITIAGRYSIGVTFYDELMKNGYTYGRDFSTFRWVEYKTWTPDGHDADGNPLFKPEYDTHRFFSYYTPLNTVWQHNRGVEYEVNLGRFDAIRTSFFLNGAWMHTMTTSDGYTFELNMNKGSTIDSHVAVYEPKVRKYHYEKSVTTLRTTHNLPSIGFVVTLSTQLNLYTRSWSRYHNDEHPQLYISNDDGKVYTFTDEMAADTAYAYMTGQRSESRFIVSKTKSTVVFNLNVSKEIGDFLTASFYVNNLFNSRPLDPSEITKGAYTELNNPMYFGFELKLKL